MSSLHIIPRSVQSKQYKQPSSPFHCIVSQPQQPNGGHTSPSPDNAFQERTASHCKNSFPSRINCLISQNTPSSPPFSPPSAYLSLPPLTTSPKQHLQYPQQQQQQHLTTFTADLNTELPSTNDSVSSRGYNTPFLLSTQNCLPRSGKLEDDEPSGWSGYNPNFDVKEKTIINSLEPSNPKACICKKTPAASQYKTLQTSLTITHHSLERVQNTDHEQFKPVTTKSCGERPNSRNSPQETCSEGALKKKKICLEIAKTNHIHEMAHLCIPNGNDCNTNYHEGTRISEISTSMAKSITSEGDDGRESTSSFRNNTNGRDDGHCTQNINVLNNDMCQVDFLQRKVLQEIISIRRSQRKHKSKKKYCKSSISTLAKNINRCDSTSLLDWVALDANFSRMLRIPPFHDEVIAQSSSSPPPSSSFPFSSYEKSCSHFH